MDRFHLKNEDLVKTFWCVEVSGRQLWLNIERWRPDQSSWSRPVQLGL